MTDMASIERFILNNSFCRMGSVTSIELEEFPYVFCSTLCRDRSDKSLQKKLSDLLMKNHEQTSSDDIKFVKEIITDAIPDFQRGNDKWTDERQSSFIWNMLRGNRSGMLIIYTLKKDLSKKFVLDGYQRITAMLRFLFDQDFFVKTPYGDFNSNMLREQFRGHIPCQAVISVMRLDFDSHVDACDHYIDINKGISHSDADIQRAIDYKMSQLALINKS